MNRMGPWGDSSTSLYSQSSGRWSGSSSRSLMSNGRSQIEAQGSEHRMDSIRRVLSDLNLAIVPREMRLAALMTAIAEFNHNDQTKHDIELDAQADRVLFQKLAFALVCDKSNEEVGLICSALEMVYRGSRNRVANAVNEFGMSALPLILMMIEGCPQKNKRGKNNNYNGENNYVQSKSQIKSGSSYLSTDKSIVASAADKSMDSIGGFSGMSSKKSLNTDSSFKTEDMESVKDINDQFNDDVSEITGWTDKLPSGRNKWSPTNAQSATKSQQSIMSKDQSHGGMSVFSDFGMSVDEMSVDTMNRAPNTSQSDAIKSHDEVLEKPPNQNGVFKILKVLRYFSRVLQAMVPLAHYSGLLDSLLYQLEKLSTDGLLEELHDLTNLSGNGIGSPRTIARIDTMAIMVNLACAEENKIMMVDHPGLLDSVINVARNDPSNEAREHSAIIFMNLSYSHQNKELLAEYDQLLSTLTKLMGDASPYTRKYAASALFALASVVSKISKSDLSATYCGSEILEALRQVLLHDPSEEARVNAAEAIQNIARGKSGDINLKLASHPNLLDALAEAVISDYSADVRAYCARTLEVVASEIHFPLNCHSDLVRALIKASQWTKTTCIAEALKIQSSVVGNRIALVSYPSLLEALASFAALSNPADSYIRSCALCAIERLSNEPQNTPIIARNKEIMEALTREGFRSQRYGESDQNMINTVKNLANALNN